MPTNEERLDVARKLRCACPEQFNDILYGIHLANVGIKACAQIVSAHKDIAVDAASRLADLIEPEPERTCEWTQDENGAWHTGCGNMFEFINGGPKENRAVFCMYCGGKVVEYAD